MLEEAAEDIEAAEDTEVAEVEADLRNYMAQMEAVILVADPTGRRIALNSIRQIKEENSYLLRKGNIT